MVITRVIVVRTTQKRRDSAFPIVLLTVFFPPQFLFFKIRYPFGFVRELKTLTKFCLSISSHVAKLLGGYYSTTVCFHGTILHDVKYTKEFKRGFIERLFA